MDNVVGGVTTLILALFPIVAGTSVHTIGPVPLIAGLCVLLALQLFIRRSRAALNPLFIVSPGVCLLLVVMAMFDSTLSVRLYPVFVNAAMAVVFSATLVWPPPMIERFARLTNPDLPASAVSYLRKLTLVWIAFFVVNGSIALWTVVAAPWWVWALYNGLIAYLLIGALFMGELCVRNRLRPHPHHTE